MNYQSDLNQSFNYTMPTLTAGAYKTYCFFSDGSNAIIDDIQLNETIYIYLGQVTNYCHRDYPNNTLIACEYIVGTGNNYISNVFLTDRLDYVIHGGGYSFGSYIIDDYATSTLTSGITSAQDYPSYTYKKYSEFTYSYYTGTLNAEYSVYDLSMIHYDSAQQYYNDSFYIRGENTSFYKHFYQKIYYTQGGAYFGYGSPLYEQRYAEYQRGYGAGYGAGWVEGNDHGYQVGINQNANIGDAPAQAFDYIGGAFGAISNIMSLEVLPNITLGLAFSIPLVFVLIMTIFKLVRK